MITPQPESDLSLNIMVVGADVIKVLKQNKDYMIVENLMKKFISRDSRRSPNLFFDTLTFLYTLGLIGEDNYKVRLKYGFTQKTLF
jgi:Fe2+ or Zn2+ uptake regulation protein